jgi:hypothetical protein
MKKENSSEGMQQARGGKPVADDPPVIVGGGSSAYIFIKTGVGTPVSPSPIPGYDCIRLPDNVTVLRVSDGISPRIHAIPLKADRFGANFDHS